MTSWLLAAAITLPPDTKLFTGKDAEMANAFCLSCHSSDYVTTQPPHMPIEFWRGVVVKMQKVYGAPIPDAQVDGLAAFFARRR